MIFIALVIVAAVSITLQKVGILTSGMPVFIGMLIIIVVCAYALRHTVKCPFRFRCPFTRCPLNRKS